MKYKLLSYAFPEEQQEKVSADLGYFVCANDSQYADTLHPRTYILIIPRFVVINQRYS